MKTAVIRVDSSFQIGSGHVMRCLAIAQGLRAIQFNVIFVCRLKKGSMIEYIQSQGFTVNVLKTSSGNNNQLGNLKHSHWLGVEQEEDAKQTMRIIKELGSVDILIIDHYGLDMTWEQYFRDTVVKIVVIDDLADRKHCCDILFDQNYYLNIDERYKGLVNSQCKLLLGPKYAMLRPEFKELRNKVKLRKNKILRVLIFFGGSDLTNETQKAIRAIQLLKRNDIRLDVVVGQSNPHKEEIKEIINDLDNAYYYCQINNIGELMLEADISIGSGGISTWERCYLGLPAITIEIASNQKEMLKSMDRFGALINLGDKSDVNANDLANALLRIDNEMLEEMSKKSLLLVEGHIDIIEKLRGSVLVLSVSKKVPLIEKIKSAINKFDSSLRLIGADSDKNCISKYFVDCFIEMPLLKSISIDDFIKICKEHNVHYIIPTRDGELLFFSKYKERLEKERINIMISKKHVVETCLDKLQFYKLLYSLNFPVIETSCISEELKVKENNYVIKERFGSGSISIKLNIPYNDVKKFAKELENPIIQPFIKGKEYSIDVYVNKQGKAKGAVVRERNLVINGESQVTTSVYNQKLEDLCMRVSEALRIYGHAVFQVIIDDQNIAQIVECNCRFGGASTLSVELGLDSFYWFFIESSGVNLDRYPFQRTIENIRQVRYSKDMYENIK